MVNLESFADGPIREWRNEMPQVLPEYYHCSSLQASRLIHTHPLSNVHVQVRTVQQHGDLDIMSFYSYPHPRTEQYCYLMYSIHGFSQKKIAKFFKSPVTSNFTAYVWSIKYR